MPLAPGTQLGPYEIAAPLGAGGMGEVYRARDTRLDRSVAIKILPAHLSSDPVRKQRFEREAKTISGLNHPHICVLHDVGHQDGMDYLVMECVEGETLAKRLERGPLPLEQVLKFGMQVADALDKAHRSGVVHRDLKPGNIMLTPNGAKLLDFGLAKPVTPLSSAATLTAGALQTTPVTEQGTIVGTFQYMSPEQVEGKGVDGRSDLFSLGAVLYEMLTGRRAFAGKSRLSVASAILEKEPEPISTLKPMTPPALDHTIRRCLAKNPEERWQTARDLAQELKWIAEAGSQASVQAERAITPDGWLWVVFVAVLVAVAVASWGWWRSKRPVEQPLVRLDVDLGPDVALAPPGNNTLGHSVIISPDGRRLVYLASISGGTRRLFTRRLDQPNATELQGTEGAAVPCFSPDGQWVGFFARGNLNKVSVDGGPVVPLGAVHNFAWGLSWGEDGNIIFGGTDLMRMSSAGGKPTPVMEHPVEYAWLPQLLPGGSALLFVAAGISTLQPTLEQTRAEVVSLGDLRRKTLVRGATGPRYLPTGHLVYSQKGTLFAIPFDRDRLETYGAAVSVLDGVAAAVKGPAEFDVSHNGTLVYRKGSGGDGSGLMTVQWLDRTGKKELLWAKPGVYNWPRLSPDGTRLLLLVTEHENQDIWICDWQRDTMTRLTFSGGGYDAPTWSPDGRYVIVSGNGGMFWLRADGAGQPQPFTRSANLQIPTSFAPDGKRLAYVEWNRQSGTSNAQIWTVPVEAEGGQLRAGKPEQFLKTPFADFRPEFSPDGRWLAYISNESGQPEVYVRPFPALPSGQGGKWQISNSGGLLPFWSRNGRELLYVDQGDQLMAVSYTVKGDMFVAEKPRVWAAKLGSAPRTVNLDLAPDGTRVAVLTPVETPGTPKVDHEVVFVQNYFDELRRRVPTGKN